MWMIGGGYYCSRYYFCVPDQIAVFVAEYYYEESTMEILQLGTEGIRRQVFPDCADFNLRGCAEGISGKRI